MLIITFKVINFVTDPPTTCLILLAFLLFSKPTVLIQPLSKESFPTQLCCPWQRRLATLPSSPPLHRRLNRKYCTGTCASTSVRPYPWLQLVLLGDLSFIHLHLPFRGWVGAMWAVRLCCMVFNLLFSGLYCPCWWMFSTV